MDTNDEEPVTERILLEFIEATKAGEFVQVRIEGVERVEQVTIPPDDVIYYGVS